MACNNFYTPLEQFEISILRPLTIFGLDFSFTNSALYLALTAATLLFVYSFGIYEATLVPSRWQSVVEMVYKFVLDMIKQQAGNKGLQYFPFLFLIFNFILFSNLLGLLPFGFTTTGHLIITFTLAFSINLGLVFIGFMHHGIKFLKLFVPSDAPVFLLPLIVVIEVVSYCLRTFSLSIRLFANMMAGHTLLHILCSFIVAFLQSSIPFLGLLPFVLVLAVIGLELGIAFLQAYVFTILVCIYLNDSLNLH
uniref:ATP synthase subunit a n=1 Tax=Phalansterium sp. PJK-2012 TaxID=1267188 RepID=T1QDU9_9EUKA|nr:ATP synthase F0 subunit 6 [Phalansterium sp. PJK-2012]